jgi:Kelch motif/Galactose oxidase, central domain
MQYARRGHTATLLLDGEVLVAGGLTASTNLVPDTEIYNPGTRNWRTLGHLRVWRANHTATLLTSGKVLLTGGSPSMGDHIQPPDPELPSGLGGARPMVPIPPTPTPTCSAEIFDPGTQLWTDTGSLNTCRYNHTAALLPDDKVLVAGGSDGTYTLNNSEIYDPRYGTWTPVTAPMVSPRFSPTSAVLPDGRVLVAGGLDLSGAPLNSAEYYDPASPGWSQASTMSTARYVAAMAVRADGQVLIVGGYNGSLLSSSDLYNPVANTWTANATMAVAREDHTATALQSGALLVAGGWNSSGYLASAEIYTPGFDGMFYGDGISPPDPHGAAGWYGILQTVNKRMHYFRKKDGTQWEADLQSLFNASGFLGDVKAIYDTAAGASGRFYVIMEENHEPPPPTCSGGGNGTDASYCNLAVSMTSDPADGTSASWYIRQIDMTQTPQYITAKCGGDYSGLGIDSQALYVSYIMFRLYDANNYPFCLNAAPCSTVIAYDSQILAIRKTDINSGHTPFINRVNTEAWGGQDQGFSLQPATPAGGSPGDVAFFAEVPVAASPPPVPPATSIRVWQLAQPLGATPTLTRQTATGVPSNLGGQQCYNGAPQSDGGLTKLSTVEGNRTINAVWNNNAVWFCTTAGGTARALPYWYRVDVSNFANGITAASGSINPGTDGSGNPIWGFYPTLGGNSRGDICLIFSESSSGTYPAIACAWRTASDTDFRSPQILKQSTVAYLGGSSERWGDFGTVTADPSDGSFWVSHEYVKSGTANQGWGTWWNIIYTQAP